MKYLNHIVLVILVAFILIARYNPAVGEWYATVLYPVIAAVFSFAVSWIPFSLEEIFVVGASALAIGILVQGVRKRQKWYKVLLKEVKLAAWVVVWFYMGWGVNYFRENIYERAAVGKQKYDETVFRNFIKDYAENLNASYTDSAAVLSVEDFSQDIKERYLKVPQKMGLCTPHKWQQPKNLLFNKLYSAVGVMGYMGPFFNEIQLNEELQPTQLPFCYAHELSHQLGVSNEDEANFWAYQNCRHSEISQVKYSGYYALLPYVLTNARRALLPDDYKSFLQSIKPEILQQLATQQEFWRSRYSKTLGELQSTLYNAMLKGNKISSGTANYIQVVDMIIAFEY